MSKVAIWCLNNSWAGRREVVAKATKASVREGECVERLRLGVRLLTSEGHSCSCFDRLGLEGKVCLRKRTRGHDRTVTEVATKASVRGQTCWSVETGG